MLLPYGAVIKVVWMDVQPESLDLLLRHSFGKSNDSQPQITTNASTKG